ncbi:polysaccharide biosynthesis/export family protein [Qipengyuania sp. CAU 1752]
MNRLFHAAIPAGVALLVAGCASTPPTQTGILNPVAPVNAEGLGLLGAEVNPATYVLAPKDTVRVSVMGEPDLSFESIRISEDGNFMMPMVGQVQAAGFTADQVAESIRATLAARYIRNPMVTVHLLEQRSHLVTVEGAVSDPGVFNFPPDTTLLGALALADGTTRYAKNDHIVLFRVIDNQQMAARFDLNLMRTGQMVDPVILPGDRIMIGTNGRARLWQDLISALPALAIFAQLQNSGSSSSSGSSTN